MRSEYKDRALGQTGLKTSALGLGLAALGRPGYINLGHAGDLGRNYDVPAMRDQTFGVLDAAWGAGIRYFDVARSYGRAEEFLAAWLEKRGIAPQSLTVGSKWGYTYTADWRVHASHHEVKDHSLAVLIRQVAESRHFLAPFLLLYQIHSATLESGVLDNQAVLNELARLRASGLTIGLTLSGERQAETLRKALTIRRDDSLLFGTVQATWNLLERSAEPALREAHDAGMGIIIKEALANGRLTARNDDPLFATRKRLLTEAAEMASTTLDGIALAAVLAQPWVDVVLSGAATVLQLTANLAALDVDWTAEMTERLAVLAEMPEAYWQTRNRLAWN